MVRCSLPADVSCRNFYPIDILSGPFRPVAQLLPLSFFVAKVCAKLRQWSESAGYRTNLDRAAVWAVIALLLAISVFVWKRLLPELSRTAALTVGIRSGLPQVWTRDASARTGFGRMDQFCIFSNHPGIPDWPSLTAPVLTGVVCCNSHNGIDRARARLSTFSRGLMLCFYIAHVPAAEESGLSS